MRVRGKGISVPWASSRVPATTQPRPRLPARWHSPTSNVASGTSSVRARATNSASYAVRPHSNAVSITKGPLALAMRSPRIQEASSLNALACSGVTAPLRTNPSNTLRSSLNQEAGRCPLVVLFKQLSGLGPVFPTRYEPRHNIRIDDDHGLPAFRISLKVSSLRSIRPMVWCRRRIRSRSFSTFTGSL